MIISIHSSYNPERLGPGNCQDMARGGNPTAGPHGPMLIGDASPDQGRLGTECKTYRSSDHDVPDAGIKMFHRIYQIVIVVDIRRTICQSLGLV